MPPLPLQTSLPPKPLPTRPRPRIPPSPPKPQPRAMSGSEAMPVSTSGISEYTTSKATTAVLWDIGPLRKGTGLSKKVFTDR